MSPRALAFALAVASLTVCAMPPATAWAQVRRDKPAKPKPDPVLTKPPQLVESVAPEYPAEAVAAQLDADVTVLVSIDDAGVVTNVTVPTPVGHGFDQAAIDAVKKYRFNPAEFDGKPGPITVQTVIHFRFKMPESQPASTQAASAPASAPATQAASAPAVPPAVLVGSVKERGTRRKLAAVPVDIVELEREVATGADGSYRFDDVPPGKYHVVALAPGFDKLTVEVNLVSQEETSAELFLRPSGGNPYETVVVGEREKLEVTRRTLQQRELTTVPGTFGDPIRVLQSLPGLARAPFASGLLIIRGSNPNESGVFIDGFEVPLLFHFLGGPSILNPEFLDTLDLYPGGFPARFGRFDGGVVEVGTKSSASDGIHGAVDINLLDSSVYMRAPLSDKVTFAFAARRSYIDALLPLVLPKPSNPGDTLTVVPIYWDYQARMDVQLPHNDKLQLLAFGSSDQLTVLQTDTENAATFDLDSHIGFHRLILTYRTKVLGGLDMSLAGMVGRDVLSLAAGERISTDVTDSVVGVRQRIWGSLTPTLRIDTGLDLEYRVTDYQLAIPDFTNFVPEQSTVNIPTTNIDRAVDRYGLGIYLELPWDIIPKLRLIPSLRADTYLIEGTSRFSLDPRLVARYQLVPDTALKAYAGVFHQPPEPEQLDPVYGNPNLQLEYAIQTGLGVEQKIGKSINIDAEVFYSDRESLAAFSRNIIVEPDGTLKAEVFNNDSNGRAYGFELLVKHDITEKFYGWLSYTLMRSEVRPQPDKDIQPTAFDQTHNLVAVPSYRVGKGWELGARYQLTTGRPITPVLGSTFDSDSNTYIRENGPAGSARRDLFSELDVRAEKTWLFETWQFSLYLDVRNVTNALNPEATQYDYRFQQTAPVRGVPILPTLGVKGQW
jgi:TonB family protein